MPQSFHIVGPILQYLPNQMGFGRSTKRLMA